MPIKKRIVTFRKQRTKKLNNNNELDWIDFILGLDSENRQILTEYVFNN